MQDPDAGNASCVRVYVCQRLGLDHLSFTLRMRTMLPAAPEPPLPVSAFHFQGQTAYLLGGRKRGTGKKKVDTC